MQRMVGPYPWTSLERLDRATLRAALDARRSVASALELERLSEALSAIVSSEVAVIARDVKVGPAPAWESFAAALELGDGTFVGLCLRQDLVVALLSRLLARPVTLTRPDGAMDASTHGALVALTLEVARRAGGVEPPRLATRSPASGAPSVVVEASVLIDQRAFDCAAWVHTGPQPTAERGAGSLAALGDVPVALALVVGLCQADLAELSTLELGDAWLPSPQGLWLRPGGAGRGALAAVTGERGLSVDLAPDGSLVVVGDLVELTADLEPAMPADDPLAATVAEAVLDTPIVVRIELGSVSMTAREWAALRPGDVIETSRRIQEPVVLRVAGREVARGELVEVEGELGVRLRELSGRGQAP